MPRSFTLPPPVHPEHVVTYLPVFYQTDDTHRNRYTLLQRSTSRSATTPMSCSCRGSKFYVPDYHGNPLPDVLPLLRRENQLVTTEQKGTSFFRHIRSQYGPRHVLLKDLVSLVRARNEQHLVIMEPVLARLARRFDIILAARNASFIESAKSAADRAQAIWFA